MAEIQDTLDFNLSWKSLNSSQDQQELKESQNHISESAFELEEKLRLDSRVIQEPYTL